MKPAKFLLYLTLSLLVNTVFSSEYSQEGFYDVNHYVLSNGMHVILKPRHIARNVSIRLKVDVGHDNFVCGKQETAHYLEHLLFTGTSKHNETELDNIIESHGGYWNATTSNEYTMYEIDIYNKYLNVGLRTLHEIMTDSVISNEDVKKSLNIIRREAGSKPSSLRNWLYINKIIQSAAFSALEDLFQGASFLCPDIDNATSVTRDEILTTVKNYYVPNNMTLSVVGDFNIREAKNLIEETMGGMLKNDENNLIRSNDKVPSVNSDRDKEKIHYGSFSPILGTDALVYQVFRVPGKGHKDQFVLDVLEEYFDRELYKLLRVEKGLSYSASVITISRSKYGAFLLGSDAEIDNVDINMKLISQVIQKFKDGDLDEKELNETKRKILLSQAKGYETNEDFAEYYARNIYDIKDTGRLVNYEDGIEAVTLKDIERVSKKYFHEDNRAIAISTPVFTYTQFYILIISMLLVIGIVIWRIVMHFRRRKVKGVNYL